MSTSRKMAGPRELEPGGSQEQPILVDEDQDVPQSGIGFEVEKLVRQVQKGDARFDPIDLDGEDDSLSEDPWRADEENYDNDNAKIEREELGNELEDIQDGPCAHWKKAVRNPCPCGTHQKVPKVTTGSMELGDSQVVELKEAVRVGRYGAEFVEIHEIWVPHKGDHIFIRGRTYARTRNLEGRVEPRKNEVCEIYELDENDHRVTDPIRCLEQALVEVPIQNIKTTRTLHKTNRAFPECRFDRVRYRTKDERENEAPLTCRWQMILSYPDPRYRRQQRPIAGEVIRHYNQDDIPKERHRVPDSERRKAHEKIRGGSFVPNGAPEAGLEASPIHLAPGQKYTVVDIFSGAGGYSKGAEMAGLKVLAACDHWPRCCETYRQNFPDAELHQKDVYKFIEDMSTDLTREHLNVDILHFSPPCQTWSPAHTCEGKKDEENRATLFACEKIITIFKPRIFTVEQTFGLAQDRWIPNFNALLQGFTRHGYSVKWKVLHLVEYGLPQTRKRLVMIGAAPGEQLPAWPRPTHSKDPNGGQKPFVSAFKACSALVEGENLHDVEGARPTNKAPWDSSKPLGRTITTSGGQCYHSGGLRELTLAEFAVFQGFPLSFLFVGKCIKKQIGNAFAPIVVKSLLKCIRVHLENFDGVTRQPAAGQIIVVSDDESNDHDDKRSQPQHKDDSHSQVGSQLIVGDLVGFCRKPSGLSQELLQGMIEDIRMNSVQFLLAKSDQKPSKDGTSPGPSPQRRSRVSNDGISPGPSPHRRSRISSRQAQLTQSQKTDSYFLPANDQDSTMASSDFVGGDSSAAPKDTADSAFTAPGEGNEAAQDVTASTSSIPFQFPSTSNESIGAQMSSTGQTIVGGVLYAPTRDLSDSDTDTPMARPGARTARTIADLNHSPRQARSASLRSTGNRSAQNAQTLAGLGDQPSPGRSSSYDAAASQPTRAGRIIGGVLIAPRRQSPPGFWDTMPRTTQTIPHAGEVTQDPISHGDQSSPGLTNATPTQAPRAVGQALAGAIRAAERSTMFPGLQVDEAAPPRAFNEAQAIAGVLETARRLKNQPGLADTFRTAGINGGADTPGPQSYSGTRCSVPRQGARTHQSGPSETTTSSSAAQTGTRAAVRSASQVTRAGNGVAGPSRRRSSGGSVACMGESSRAGARRSLAIVVEDEDEDEEKAVARNERGDSDDEGAHKDENPGEEEEDSDQQLQRAIMMSLADSLSIQDAVGEPDSRGSDRRELALAFQQSMLDKYRRRQGHEPEKENGDVDDDAAAPGHEPEPEREMYGPGDYKGKGKAVATRTFDEYDEDEDEDAEREGGPSKRPRGSK